MKTLSRIMVGVAAAGIAASLATPASAADRTPAPLPESTIAQVQKFWTEHGVSTAAQQRLVKSIAAGNLPQSMQPAATPVAQSTEHVGAFQQTTETFADGSVRVLQIQDQPGVVMNAADPIAAPVDAVVQPADAISPMASGVSNCSVSSGSGYSNYSNCLVKGTDGNLSNWFYASWTLVQGAANDQLTWTGNPGQNCGWPYFCGQPSRTTYVSRETSSTRAGATYTGTYQQPLGTGTTYLSITVGNNTYFPTWTVV